MKKKTIVSAFIIILALFAGWIYLSQEPPPIPLGEDESCNGKWYRGVKDAESVAGNLTATMPYEYPIPYWYQKDIVFVDESQIKFGNEIEVFAKVMPWLTDMENVEIEYVLSDGLRMVKGEALDKGCAGSTGAKCAFTENIPKCKIREMPFTVKWESEPDETQRIHVILRFDFPRQALLQYVEENKNMQYDDPWLQEKLIELIQNFDDREDASLGRLIY